MRKSDCVGDLIGLVANSAFERVQVDTSGRVLLCRRAIRNFAQLKHIQSDRSRHWGAVGLLIGVPIAFAVNLTRGLLG